MRSLLYLFTTLGVIALAAWAYRENHLTQSAMNERRALEREIASLEESLRMQRAEWAYLNRPDRLRELVDLNFEKLRLVPITALHFGEIGEVAYPMPDFGANLEDGIEVFGAFEPVSEGIEEEQP